MVSINFYVKIVEMFYQPKNKNKNQATEKQGFSPERHSCITLKIPKNKFPH